MAEATHKAYVWDRNYQGAVVIVATSAEEAAAICNATYPTGFSSSYRSKERFMPTAEHFTEVKPGEIMLTEGDC